MLLKPMLESPIASSKLVVADPFKPFNREFLLREVIGLANAKVEGPRNILFGVNPSAVNGNTLVGIPEEAIGELKRAHRLISSLIEPGLDLAFVFDKINGKIVGTLEIDGCDFGPYFLAHDLSEELYRGACWIRQDRDLMPIERHLLTGGLPQATSRSATEPVQELTPEDVNLSVGFGNDADCDYVELSVPDTLDPPFTEVAKEDFGRSTLTALDFTQTLSNRVGTLTAKILRMAQQEPSANVNADDTQDISMKVADAAKKHYYLEERAARLEVCIRNNGNFDTNDISVEIGFPQLDDFEVAHRLYPNPFDKGSEAALRTLRYPRVIRKDGATVVKVALESVGAAESRPLFGTPLRIAIGPEALGRKIAIQYVIRRSDGLRLDSGRLKMRLGQPLAHTPARIQEQTHYHDLEED